MKPKPLNTSRSFDAIGLGEKIFSPIGVWKMDPEVKYTQRDFVGLPSLAWQAVKLLGLALALPIGLLCGWPDLLVLSRSHTL